MAKKTALEIIGKAKDRIGAVLPLRTEGAKQRFMELAFSACKDSDLMKCTPESLASAIYYAAKLGLAPDAALGHVYLVKYGNTCVPITGYRGFIELARRGGGIQAVSAQVVYKNDVFEYSQGLTPHLKHTPYWVAGHTEPGERIGVYCVAELSAGCGYQVQVMPWSDVMKIKGRAASKSGPWETDENEMARKTVVRLASKYWPMNPELAAAVRADEQLERGEKQTAIDVSFSEKKDIPADGRHECGLGENKKDREPGDDDIPDDKVPEDHKELFPKGEKE